MSTELQELHLGKWGKETLPDSQPLTAGMCLLGRGLLRVLHSRLSPLSAEGVVHTSHQEETKHNTTNGRESNWSYLRPHAQVNTGLERVQRFQAHRSQLTPCPECWMAGSVGQNIPNLSSQVQAPRQSQKRRQALWR